MVWVTEIQFMKFVGRKEKYFVQFSCQTLLDLNFFFFLGLGEILVWNDMRSWYEMKSMEEYVPVRLFILQFKVVLTYFLARKWNLEMCSFKWKLLSITFLCCYLFNTYRNEMWVFCFLCERVKIILFMGEVRWMTDICLSYLFDLYRHIYFTFKVKIKINLDLIFADGQWI